MAITPVAIEVPGYNDPNFSMFRNVGHPNISDANNISRVHSHSGNLYTILFDPYGDEDVFPGPNFLHNVRSAHKSTNTGLTWTAVDWANRIVGFEDGATPVGDTTITIGDDLWLIHDYGEHIDLIAGTGTDFTGQFDRIHVVPFNMATDTFGALNTSGPSRTPAGTARNAGKGHLVCDACYRGSNEIIVYHNDTDASVSVNRLMYSIWNAGSLSWTSTNNVVFTSTTTNDMNYGSCRFDGTYVHFTAQAGYVLSTSSISKLHRTLNSANTLGTISDMLASYPGSLPALASANIQNYDYQIAFNGEVIVVQLYYGHSRFGAPYQTWKVLAFNATSGVQNPSWTVADIGSVAWETPYDFDGESGTPILVESEGSLYCIAGGFMLGLGGFNPTTDQYWIFTQKYLGSGAWQAPVEFWDYRDSYGGSGSLSKHELFKVSAIGNLTGDDELSLGVSANMNGWPGDGVTSGGDTVYWFYDQSSVCCYCDFAF